MAVGRGGMFGPDDVRRIVLEVPDDLVELAPFRRQAAEPALAAVPALVVDVAEAVSRAGTKTEIALFAGLEVVPGAASPTEISTAVTMGATMVKVFPAAQLGGPGYLRAIHGVLGQPALVPTGGITADDAAAYLAAGATALGVGSAAFRRELLESGDEAGVHDEVARFVAEVST